MKVDFLIDTGADRTVLSAETLENLQLESAVAEKRLSGVGGEVDTVTVATAIRFDRGGNLKATFHGTYAAFTQLEALELSVLGRDILNLFALIVDREADTVSLLRPPHAYTISAQ